MRIFALLWALVLCQGCQYRYWVEEQRFGVFVEREHWEEHKRTYETGVRYGELCNTVTEDCYRHGGRATSRVRYSVGHNVLSTGVIAVSFNNRNGGIFEESHLEMFPTADGVRLPCENCAGGFERSVEASVSLRRCRL